MNSNHVFTKRSMSMSLVPVLCIWLMLGISGAPASAQDVPAAAKAAAQKGFRPLLKAIPAGELARFNFSNPDDVRQATLGEGFRVFTISPDLILNYDGRSSVQEMIRPTSLWFFPVVAGGQVRTMITVDMVDGQYRAVSVGGSGVAVEWARAQVKWPSSSGYTRVFLRIYQATADFVVVSDASQTKMAPLPSGKTLLGGGEAALLDLAEVLPGLQEAVRVNMDAARLMDQAH
jgi:hypothetical protein